MVHRTKGTSDWAAISQDLVLRKNTSFLMCLFYYQVILSACSPFFRQILRRNPHQHPLLYLKVKMALGLGLRVPILNELEGPRVMVVQHFRLKGEFTSAQERCMS